MALDEVWLWSPGDVLASERWERPTRVTDVFRRDGRPTRGSVVLGLDERARITVVGIAGPPQPIATGKVRVALNPLFYDTPVPLSAVLERLAPRLQRRYEGNVATPAPLRASRLSAELGREVLRIVREVMPEVDAGIRAWRHATEAVTGETGLRLREERDAVALAVDLAGIDVPVTPLVTPPSRSGAVGFAQSLGADLIDDNEDDLLAEDMRRFDAGGAIRMEKSSVARFVDRDFALTIFNVNRKPIEKTLGVDLLYLDETRDIFTLIQYKRLTSRDRADHEEAWAYTRKSELEKQLDLMSLDQGDSLAAHDWRLTTSPFWFKFVRTNAFDGSSQAVLPGMYVAADYLRLALVDGSNLTGPRSGFEVTYSNTKYISRQPFVELVRKGLVGSTKAGTEQVWELLTALAGAREVVVAVKSSVSYEPDADDLAAFSDLDAYLRDPNI